MDAKQILEAFAELSPEDQRTVRAAIAAEGGPSSKSKEGGSCEGMAASMTEMMEKMKSCSDMMAMCEEMKKKKAGSCCGA